MRVAWRSASFRMVVTLAAMVAVMALREGPGGEEGVVAAEEPAYVAKLPAAPKGIYISEVMAKNVAGLRDEDGDFSAWIELHNPTEKTIELKGYYLSDDAKELKRWGVPDVSIAAGGYLVVFASGKDRAKASSPLHANFALKGEKPYLALVGPDGNVAHDFGAALPMQQADVSYGIDVMKEGVAQRYFARPTPGAANVRAEVVINEIHYDPGSKIDRSEFIEFFNPGEAEVDLSGARFEKGITYVFSEGTILGPKSYLILAQDPARFAARFGGAALGPWEGALSNGGEDLVLVNRSGGMLDLVDYRATHPWPTLGQTPARSIQLINVDLDNGLAGNWRAGLPTGVRVVEEKVLVEARSDWKYRKGINEASQPRTAWRQARFDDSDWFEGRGPIGYESTAMPALGTRLNDMRGKYRSVFFRKEFEVDDPGKIGELHLDALFDDGINVWINGRHVLMQNVPGAEMSYGSVATVSTEDENYRTFTLRMAPGVLAAGKNVIAVQLHNQATSSTDAYFDARLSARRASSGGRNVSLVKNPPAQVRQVKHGPKQPKVGEAVTVSAKVMDVDGVKSVELLYRIVEPGRYVTLNDPAFHQGWSALPMTDDGTNGDTLAGDGVYAASIPGEAQAHRRLVRYRVKVTDELGQSTVIPDSEDAQPNFAYFVYGGAPAWTAAARPGRDEPVTYSAELMNSMQALTLIAKQKDVEEAIWRARYTGSEFPWVGTLVYDGTVYDHVGFRPRGGMWRNSFGKNMWKFKAANGHEFQLNDDDGKPLKGKWDSINLSAGIQHGNTGHRGEHGMFDAVSFGLMRMAGVPTPKLTWMQLRVVDEESEIGRDQYSGDLWGMYLAIEQPDGGLLKSNGLPDGNLYKMEQGKGLGNGELQNLGPGQPHDHSDLVAFTNGYQNFDQPESWWRRNVELDTYYSYRSIIECVHHYDIGQGKNYLYYHNPKTSKWTVLPWDMDLTWGNHVFGDGHEPFRDRVLPQPRMMIEYQNRLREIRDLLYNADQTGQLIDELAARIYTPGKQSWVDVDRAVWDFHPAMSDPELTPVENNKAGAGRYYAGNSTVRIPRPGGFPGMIQLMKNYVRTRGAWVDANFLDDAGPRRPVAVGTGEKVIAADAMRFRAGDFVSNDGEFAGMKWRIARVSEANPAIVRNAPRYYEMNAAWESEEIKSFTREIVIPREAVEVGGTYRVRLRMKDSSGRWSHWSEPVQFVAGEAGNAIQKNDAPAAH